ncbi:replication protein [Lacticaseibacillus paracasei]|uniref:replication protein n=1 Tax=Lacticaseibacillus paracasei TaxID=1597 RepID=UPI001F50D1B5|nr:replication protein [Lacticaseibacillus paracasei]MCI0372878.1 replication protein [Lacticaseibacillus paracasei]MCI0374671.1 replication protein [Lacticaseibacillus paracasei]MCI0375720.1 replication protein [Lacticaseibacillus paracasei]
MADGGWIKLYRVLLDDDLWIDCTPVQKVVMITLLLMANHQERKWIWQGKKFVAGPGQLVTSLESIKQESGKGISVKNVRSALDKFVKVGFLANQSAKTGRLITIANWAKYQISDDEVANQPANRWQTTGKQVATNKNVKNDKNVKKEDSQHSRKREYADDSPEMIEAVYLWEKIKGNNPEHRKPSLQAWADDIRKMHELDHRPFEKIHKMIDWCQIDTFWQTNILSASKLRSKYDTMAAQANRKFSSGRRIEHTEAKENWGYGVD